jgi:hypothetical protein
MNHTPKEKEVVHRISLCVCCLLKSDTPPPSSASLLVYVNEMKSLPTPASKYDFPKNARLAWDKMLDTNSCLNKYKK